MTPQEQHKHEQTVQEVFRLSVKLFLMYTYDKEIYFNNNINYTVRNNFGDYIITN